MAFLLTRTFLRKLYNFIEIIFEECRKFDILKKGMYNKKVKEVRKMKKVLICLMMLGLLIGVSSFASAAVQQGDTTLTLSLGFSDMEVPDPDFSSWDITGRVALGKFLTNNFQLEGLINGTYGDIEGESYHYVSLLVRPNFHFATESATVPYIGVAAGLFTYDIFGEDSSEFMYGGQVGIKQFIRDNVFLQIEGSYLRTEFLGEETNIFKVLLGLGFKL